jgi:hypothetical protein
MSEPISLDLLIHSATLYPCVTGGTFGTAVSLINVRFRSVRQNAMTSLGEMKSDLFTMVFDCANSGPSGTTFKNKDKIVFGAFTLYVRKVTQSDGDTVGSHHFELSLV